MNEDTKRAIDALDLITIQWETPPNTKLNFKMFLTMWPCPPYIITLREFERQKALSRVLNLIRLKGV